MQSLLLLTTDMGSTPFYATHRYTGNHLPGPAETPIQGKDGAIYKRRDGFAIEPQGWPTALVHPQFPSIIVRPGQIYEQQLVWDFSVTK